MESKEETRMLTLLLKHQPSQQIFDWELYLNFDNTNNNIIIGGDMNEKDSHLHTRQTSKRGRIPYAHSIKHNYEV